MLEPQELGYIKINRRLYDWLDYWLDHQAPKNASIIKKRCPIYIQDRGTSSDYYAHESIFKIWYPANYSFGVEK